MFNNIHTIVAATDFSTTSNYAIKRALEFAKLENAKLTLLNVPQKPGGDTFINKLLNKLLPKNTLIDYRKINTTILEEKMTDLSRHYSNLNYIVLTSGKPGIKILQYTSRKKIGLLVIGSHGTYTKKDLFIGTTAEYLAERVQCPLLIVRNPPNRVYDKILVPLDFSKVSKKALDYALTHFPESKIQLLHVGDYEFEELLRREEYIEQVDKKKINSLRKSITFYLQDKMNEFLKQYPKKFSSKIIFGYPRFVIQDEADKMKVDLIIMGTEGHGHHPNQPLGSVANHVLTETNKDILFVPPKFK